MIDNTSKKVLITGANGFIGKAITEDLRNRGLSVVQATRNSSADSIAIGEINRETDWSAALKGCDIVVHTAARVHKMHENAERAEKLYQATNVDGTLNLAKQAITEGVKRLIFLSSIKAMGEVGHFTAETLCQPLDAYGRSKYDAENALQKLSKETGLEVVILRLPLVYGQGVKGNFESLIRAIKRGIPLPFTLVHNARSLLYLGNLTDLIAVCLEKKGVESKVWLPSDGSLISTPELISSLAKAMNLKARLIPVPPLVMVTAGRFLGKSSVVTRILGDLSVDSAPLFHDLQWKPPFTFSDGIKLTTRTE